jgi:hypothetical protein
MSAARQKNRMRIRKIGCGRAARADAAAKLSAKLPIRARARRGILLASTKHVNLVQNEPAGILS